jgi:hypothetical protein
MQIASFSCFYLVQYPSLLLPHFFSEDLYIPWGFLLSVHIGLPFAWRWSGETGRWLNAYLLVGEGETITTVYMMLLCFSVR